MSKCKLCGKKGLFLKVDEKGVCADCQALAKREARLVKVEAILADKEKLIKDTQQEALLKIEAEISLRENTLASINNIIISKTFEQQAYEEKLEKTIKDWENASKKVAKIKPLYKSFFNIFDSSEFYYLLSTQPEKAKKEFESKFAILEDENFISPTVQLHMHSMDLKDLRKKLKENKEAIDTVVNKYLSKYNTKANRTIYSLMSIALEA